MANTSKPFGLRPTRHITGAPYAGDANLYFIDQADTNDYWIGRPVTLTGTGDTSGIPGVTVGVAGAAIVGVIVGILPVKPVAPSLVGLSLTLETTNIPVSKNKDYYVLVADDPFLVFEIQEDSVGGALTVTNIGHNADFIVTDPAQAYQYDATQLDSSTAAVTATLNLKLLRPKLADSNEIGDFAVWEVMINNHLFKAGIAGV